jgi:uncharacterized protein (DUF433 family)
MSHNTLIKAEPQRPLTTEDLRGDLIQPGHSLFGIIWINRERMSGAPCFAGTRVPIQNLFDYVQGGETVESFLDGFPGVTESQVQAVLALAGHGFLEGLPQV